MNSFNKLPHFLMYLFACAMVLKDWIEVLVKNAIRTTENVIYVVSDSVIVGAVALAIVGLTIVLKRDIWAYAFLLVVIASFFPVVSFTNFQMAIFIGPIKLDVIAIPLLLCHVLLNIHLFKFPERSRKEEQDSTEERVNFFMNNFVPKTDEELLRMDESDLLPEAIEARKRILEQRGL